MFNSLFRMRIFALIAAFFCLSGIPASAIVIIPRPYPPMPPVRPRLENVIFGDSSVDITVKNDAAKTSISQSFKNPNSVRIEADVYIPIPPDALITDFSFMINGKMQKGELMDKDKARKTYEDIVREMRDPGLLEFAERGLAHVRLFPIEPNSKSEIQYEFVQTLKADQGTYRLLVPLKNSDNVKTTDKCSQNIKVKLFPISETQTFRNIYSPSHKLDIIQPKTADDPIVITANTTQNEENTNKDLTIYFEKQNRDLAFSLLSEYDIDSTQGTFMLLFDPPVTKDDAQDEPEAQDVVFALDVSGSMSGDKIVQACNSLKQCVNMLRPGDRFGLLQFSSTIMPWNDGTLIDASKENKEKAIRWIEKIRASGGTNIGDALETALKMNTVKTTDTASKRLHTIIFITDGLPTVGVTDVNKLLDVLAANNKSSLRVFTFGLGFDVNTRLLDQMAENTRAASDYVKPGENIEVPVSHLFDKISRPAMINLSMKIDGVETSDIYPPKMPDLFYGTQLTVLGRYDKPGTTTVTLKGTVRGEERTYTFAKALSAPAKLDSSAFLETLWATRKAGWLVQQIRASGESQELRDELTALAKKYNIATPYTSLIVIEDKMPVRDGGRAYPHRQAAAPGFMSLSTSADTAVVGEQAVAMSKTANAMKSVEQVADMRVRTEDVFTVDAQTNLIKEDSATMWRDTALDKDAKADITVKFLSEAWFEAAALNAKLKAAFAAGDAVMVRLPNGVIVEVSPDQGLERLDDKVKEKLTAR